MLVAFFPSEPSCPSHPCAVLQPAGQQQLSLGVCGPVQGVDLGQVSPQGPSGPHLDTSNNLHSRHNLEKELQERKNLSWTTRNFTAFHISAF